MKTAKSSTKNDLGKFLVDLAIDNFNSWATKEFNALRHTARFPVCVPLSEKCLAVGNFEVYCKAQRCWAVSYDKKLIHNFYSKQAAIFYAVFTSLKYYKVADNILLIDMDVAKRSEELLFYNNKIKTVTKKTDPFKYQLWHNRHSDVKAKYHRAKQELEKTLNSAKYMKIWDEIL